MKISIVTITLNSEAHIEQTIRSVLEQTYNNIEFIIVDGGSTDETVSIIRRYAERLDQWLSEPDNGISDAMNKGFAMANGDFILFLHSDDFLSTPETIERAVSRINPATEIHIFDVFQLDHGKKSRISPRGWNSWMNLKTGIFHQGALCRRSLFERIGLFKTSLALTMDYDFFLRAYRSGARAQYHNLPLSVIRTTGISSRKDRESLRERLAEEKSVHISQCRGALPRFLYSAYWAVYPHYRLLLASKLPSSDQI